MASWLGRHRSTRNCTAICRILRNSRGNSYSAGSFENSVSRWFTARFARENPELIAALAEQNRRNDPAAYAAAYRVLAESDLAERLHQIDRPTLVITGENDVGSNPRMARLMHVRIKGSQLTIIPEQKHSILTDVPDLVADLLVRFLRDERT